MTSCWGHLASSDARVAASCLARNSHRRQLCVQIAGWNVEQMFEAVYKEWDAKIRQSLDPDGLVLYENRQEDPERFHRHMFGLDQPTRSTNSDES